MHLSYSLATRVLLLGFVTMFVGFAVNKGLGFVELGVYISFTGFAIILGSGIIVIGVWIVKLTDPPDN